MFPLRPTENLKTNPGCTLKSKLLPIENFIRCKDETLLLYKGPQISQNRTIIIQFARIRHFELFLNHCGQNSNFIYLLKNLLYKKN